MEIYQHPLAYLLGLEGVALLRAFAGEHDRDFTAARFAEIRALLDRADEFGPGSDVPLMPTARGYDGWARTYDIEDNGSFPLQDEVLLPLLDRLPPGEVIDVACGTGRITRELVRRGHRVRGFDQSPGMLEKARKALPEAEFAEASMTALPVPDGSADHVVCTLALGHLPDLEPFFAEAARVLRPGGHLVVSDTRGHYTGSWLYPLVKEDTEGNVGYVRNWSHPTGAYLRAALRHGFGVRACEEPLRPHPTVDPDEAAEPLDLTEPPDVWTLHPWIPEAANAARAGLPALIIWDFQLA
ncbi:class I SAM-dependent methyltransferase [Hamadaea tsunoensis]|uniref:class I SAM-dependent methyltransferase n=1 Tax=Hamadaea tsunoensis TaxID=53368 RepID=UPI0003F9C4BA|nr:class I SAM-dependent methyltransferase [Hamadaea tsunoensis]